ncbi:endophilin-B1-like isoform X3 [Brachionus plicatilis]|uniref:Endophilin-B1-like isoform X3 n=1 Tax=Brachionus plicatilis TaxID=10195 RepID=A0A3M7RWI4_BRAPC|nr:endophilin-B1-like isoform X3 [Brachionus plicatilis]
MDNFKKAAAEASSFFNRAKQFTEEKLGNAEKTVYQADLENLIRRSESTKYITEKIISSTTSLLHPNPNERLEELVMTKLDRRVMKPTNFEILGSSLIEAGNEVGNTFQYGSVLIKVGEAEKKLGNLEKDFIQKSSDCLLQPLKSFLEGQMKTILKEKRILDSKRLNLDASKARLKKLHDSNSHKHEAEEEVRQAQTEFDRQYELTKLLMDELTITYNHHLQCLADFVEAQSNYYSSCSRVMQDLTRQIGISSIRNTSVIAPKINEGHPFSYPINSLPVSFTEKKRAKVLFDYEATEPSEMSVYANQIITIQIVPNDNDWVLAESGRDSGKVPKAYVQIVD